MEMYLKLMFTVIGIMIVILILFLINFLLCKNKTCRKCMFGKTSSECNLKCLNGIIENNICKCNKNWTGQLCDKLKCEGNFVPDESNKNCVCESNYTGDNCDYSKSCTTEPKCSGNGACETSKFGTNCKCNAGFSGIDCSKKPTFEGCNTDPPCSGHGACSADGTFCGCNDEWIGYNCEIPA